MLIREIQESDRSFYIDLYERTAGEGQWIGGELPVDHEELSARVDRSLTLDNVVILVAVDADEVPIGHLGCVEATGIVHFGMMVEPDARGQGVGRELLVAAIDWARGRGAHKMALEVWPHNERAQALYRSVGFEVEGRLIHHYRRNSGELWDCLIMGLVVSGDNDISDP